MLKQAWIIHPKVGASRLPEKEAESICQSKMAYVRNSEETAMRKRATVLSPSILLGVAIVWRMYLLKIKWSFYFADRKRNLSNSQNKLAFYTKICWTGHQHSTCEKETYTTSNNKKKETWWYHLKELKNKKKRIHESSYVNLLH